MGSELDVLSARYPQLAPAIPALAEVVRAVIRTLEKGNTLFVAGNGGSAADAEHIAGEMLKGFLSRRALPAATIADFAEKGGAEGAEIAEKLQGGLRCISLLSHPAFASAFANDVDPKLIFAQQLYALARPGDIVLGISTGGNAENIGALFLTARALALPTILLTGNRRGRLEQIADMVIAVDAAETYKIQELHLPVYHALCAAVEAHFFPAQ